jgi:hypothetical protein
MIIKCTSNGSFVETAMPRNNRPSSNSAQNTRPSRRYGLIPPPLLSLTNLLTQWAKSAANIDAATE